MLNTYIGWDSRFPIVADVLAYSIKKWNSFHININFLKKYELANLGIKFKPDPKATTEFTYSRFLVPYLNRMAINEWALFLDNDMLCYNSFGCDLLQLINNNNNGKILFVRKHNYQPEEKPKMYGCMQTAYPRKNWSSMMLMNTTELAKIWTPDIVSQADGARLHQFKDIPDELIGDLPEGLNDLTHKTDKTKILHYTEGGPWYEQYKNCPHAEDWLNTLEEMRN